MSRATERGATVYNPPVPSICRPPVWARAAWLCLALCAGTAARAQAAACDAAASGIPPRPPQAPGAQAFVAAAAGDGDAEREQAVRASLLAGNLPDFLRRALPVVLDGRRADGRSVRVTLCVLPDYLAIGNDHDFVTAPMGLSTALAVARAFGFTLPTRRIVDLIHRAAAVHLAPQPLPPGDAMRTLATALLHQGLVQEQRNRLGAGPGALTDGHKKDLVLSPRLWQVPGRVAIYGWFRDDGRPIQSLSTVHGARYSDYSHGVRLVARQVLVDGRPMAMPDLLADPDLAPLLSDEGPLPRVATLQAALAAVAPAGS